MNINILKSQAEIIETACLDGEEVCWVDIEVDGDIDELIRFYLESTELFSHVSISWDFLKTTTRENGKRVDCYELGIEYTE